jgi:hypothetical protein
MTLPHPHSSFRWTTETWGPGLRSVPLAATAQHVFTTRQPALRSDAGGVGTMRGETERAWHQAVAAIGGSPARLCRVRQVHGARVRLVDRRAARDDAPGEEPEADALASAEADMVLAVEVADCVPILMADRRTGAAAAVHAGWRGTRAGVAAAAVHVLERDLDVTPSDLIATLGPAIGPCCYAVGDEVVAAFRDAGMSRAEGARWFTCGPDAALRLDLWRANRDQLVGAGLRPGRVFQAGLCTHCHPGLFASFRAAGAQAGRMAGLVRVPGPPRTRGLNGSIA